MTTKNEESMNPVKFGLYGALIGLAFPIYGTIFQAVLDPANDGFFTRLGRAQGQPIAWLLDLMPLMLGLGGWFLRSRQERVGSADDGQRQAFVDTARQLFAATQNLVSSVSSFTSMNSETAASLRETTASISQLGQTAAQAAVTAETVVGLADASRASYEQGIRTAEESMGEMAALTENVRGLSGKIGDLHGRLRDVFEIASVVSYMADRFQRLTSSAVAEMGKVAADRGLPMALRFIVAELSRQSAEAKAAATRVKALLGDVHSAMMGAVTAAEDGVRRAEQSAKVASSTGENIQRLATALRDSSRAAKGIAVVALQQDKRIEDLLKSMNEIFLASEEAMQSTKHVAEQAKTLTELAHRLDHTAQA